MNDIAADQFHASAVVIDGHGVLLLGPSGAGKSDLALRLIDGGATLVADDRVDVTPDGGKLMLSAPETLAGLIEVRGLGIVRVLHAARAPLALICDLYEDADIERLPDSTQADFMGVRVMRFGLDPFHASAPAKIRLALSAGDKAMLHP